MEILFLCHRIPYPPNKGDKIRSHALLAHLAKRHRVHVACFIDDPADWTYRDAVKSIAGGECFFVPQTTPGKWLRTARAFLTAQPITTSVLDCGAIRNWISTLVRAHRIDRTVVFSSGMAPYVLDHPELDPCRAILDMVDVDSDKWRQYGEITNGIRGWVFRREAEKLKQFERTAASRFAATAFVSDFEVATFASVAPESVARVFAIPNGVDLNFFAPGEFPNPFGPHELPIVMTGRMDYRPNIDAVEWFSREVLPQIKSQRPAARFYAVGANPPASWRSSGYPGLAAAGQVPDVRPYIQHAAAVVAPLRIARGIQNKVLEAMAMEKSIVATSDATRALAIVPGVELQVENDPALFAAAVVNAIGDREFGKNARRYVETHHDWQRNLEALDRQLEAIGERPSRVEHAGKELAGIPPRSNPTSKQGSIAEPVR